MFRLGVAGEHFLGELLQVGYWNATKAGDEPHSLDADQMDLSVAGKNR